MLSEKDVKVAMDNRIDIEAAVHDNLDTYVERVKRKQQLGRLSRMFSLTDYQETVLEDLLIEDETLADENSNHLLIAANVAFADTKQIEQGDLRAYISGGSVVIQTRENDEWSKARVISLETATILGHARAKARLKEIEQTVLCDIDESDPESEPGSDIPTFSGHFSDGSVASAIKSGRLEDHSVAGNVSIDLTEDEDHAMDAVRTILSRHTE